MADATAILRIRANAIRSLKASGPQIAAQLGIEPPKLDFFFKDSDYQQAQELTVLAEWLTTVNEVLVRASSAATEDPSRVTEGGDNGKHAKTKNPQPGG